MKIQTGIFKRIILCFALVFALELALASPPELPVLIYGKVIAESGEGIGGVEVKASWIEGSNIKSTFSRTSDGDLKGTYKFFIQETSGINNIKIEASGESVLFKAEKGLMIEAPNIVIKKQETNPTIIDYLSGIFNEEEEKEVTDESTSPYDFPEQKQLDLSDEEIEEEPIEEKENETIQDEKPETEPEEKPKINYSIYEINRTISPDNHFSPIIDRLDDEIYVCEGEKLVEFFNVSDRDGDEMIVWTSSELFYLEKIKSEKGYSKIMMFSDTITKEDIGTHQITVFASDEEYADIKEITISVIEVNSKPMIETIPLMTVSLEGGNKDFFYKIHAEDFETNELDYSLNILNGKNIFNINNNGEITASFTKSDIGVYNLKVCVKDKRVESVSNLCGDKGPNEACEECSLTVTEKNIPPEISKSYPEENKINFSYKTEISFQVHGEDADGTVPDVYWYVKDVLEKHDRGNKSSYFTYSSPCMEGREIKIKAVITDGILNETKQWTLDQKSCHNENLTNIDLGFSKVNPIIIAVLSFIFLTLGVILIMAAIRFLRLKKKMEELR